MNRPQKLTAAALLATALGGGVVATTAFAADRPTPSSSEGAKGEAKTSPEGHRGGREEAARTQALAQALGVTDSKLEDALIKVREARRAQRPQDREAEHRKRKEALAKALGVTPEKLEAALKAHRPERGAKPDSAALAKALGVTEAKLTEALAAQRQTQEADHKAREAEFAKAIAQELGLQEAKVTQALADSKPTEGFGRGGRGERGGHGPRVSHGAPGSTSSSPSTNPSALPSLS